MAIALFTINATVHPLQRSQQQQSTPAAAAHTLALQAAPPAARVLCRPANLARPGGLLIAGRLEDVCAELDRLVAMEALH